MKSKGKKMLAALLAILLVLSTGVLPVYADDTPDVHISGPKLYAGTESSIVLKAEAGYKYAIQISKEDTKEWQWAKAEQYNMTDQTVSFDNLEADTSYTFACAARDTDKVEDTDIQTYKTKPLVPEEKTEAEAKETGEKEKPETKEPPTNTPQITEEHNNDGTVDIPTPKTPQKADKPSLPNIESRTDTSITFKLPDDLDAKFAQGYQIHFSKDGGSTFEPVSAPYEVTGLTAGTDYIYYAIITAGTYEETPYEESDPTENATVTTFKSAADAPLAPVITVRTENSITLEAKDRQEFATVDNDGTISKWQTSPEFKGLTPNTAYNFVTRFVYNPEEALESKVSDKTTAKTIISFTGSAITGITPDATYAPGTTLTAAATGNGMDNKNPVKGDTRWAPDSWYWNSKKVSKWDKEPYTIPFTLKTAGNYKLTVNFRLEEYNGSAWTSLDRTKATAIQFKVAAPAVTKYTISAASGSGGTISPSGNVSVEKGKSSTFTFSANKNYKVSKVYVDGKEIKVKNNKYTFENVASDHKISVTFEKTSKPLAAKTGDNSLLPFWIVAVLSGCCIIVFLIKRKIGKNKVHN